MPEQEAEERNTGAGGTTGSETGPTTGAGGTTGTEDVGPAAGETGGGAARGEEGGEAGGAGREGDWNPGSVTGGGEVY